MSKRLQMLEAMTQAGSVDPFAWYGLAVEYKNLGRIEEAVGTFEKLRNIDKDYLPMYLIAGQTLIAAGRPAEAKPWLLQGQELATRKGDMKAFGELGSALEEIG
jgi:tetratricopeptide (TPR) repeat protein